MKMANEHHAWLSFMLAACLWFPLVLRAQGVVAPEDFQIVIEGARVEINGIHVEWPVSIQKLTEIIGERPRTFLPDNTDWVWDNYGISILSYRNRKYDPPKLSKTLGNELVVYIRKKIRPPYLKDEFRPKHNFRGTLIVDGVRITPGMTVAEINAKKRGRAFYQRPAWWKFKSYANFPDRKDAVMKMLFKVHKDLTVNRFYIWLWEYHDLPTEEKVEPVIPRPEMSEEEERFWDLREKMVKLIEEDNIPEIEKLRRFMLLLHKKEKMKEDDRKIIEGYEQRIKDGESRKEQAAH